MTSANTSHVAAGSHHYCFQQCYLQTLRQQGNLFMSAWYYRDADGNECGPVTRTQLGDLVKQGMLTLDSLVRHEEQSENHWVPLRKFIDEVTPSKGSRLRLVDRVEARWRHANVHRRALAVIATIFIVVGIFGVFGSFPLFIFNWIVALGVLAVSLLVTLAGAAGQVLADILMVVTTAETLLQEDREKLARPTDDTLK